MSRVLVVDDSRTVREVVQRTLARAGYDVTVAGNGTEALEASARVQPDLALIDLVMPDMDGVQLSERLRSAYGSTGLSIVIMSARAEELTTKALVESGASDALAKPFGPDVLRAVVARALSRRRDSALPSREALPAAPNLLEQRAADRLVRELNALVRDIGLTLPLSPEALTHEMIKRWGPAKLASVGYDMYRFASGTEQEITVEGRLDAIALVDVLQLLQQHAKTGLLHLRYGHRSVQVCLREGLVDMALGEGSEREFLLGRFLVEERVLSESDLESVVGQVEELGWLGERLVASGTISNAQLRNALVRQTSELLYETLRWGHGSFRFVENAERPEARHARLGLPVAALIIEGLRRAEEWKTIEDKLYDYSMVLDHRRDAVAGFQTTSLTPDEYAILESVNGERSVQDLVDHAAMSPYDTCRILFRLLTAGLIAPKRLSSTAPPISPVPG